MKKCPEPEVAIVEFRDFLYDIAMNKTNSLEIRIEATKLFFDIFITKNQKSH